MPDIFRISFCLIYIWVGVGESGEMWFVYVYVCVSPHICVNLQINVGIFPHLTIKCIFRTQVTTMEAKTLNIWSASSIRSYRRYCLKIASSKAMPHSHMNWLQDWPSCMPHIPSMHCESPKKWKLTIMSSLFTSHIAN